MPHLVYTDQALSDLRRLRGFLRPKNPNAALRAGKAILLSLDILETNPEIGRPLDEKRRELVIPFSNAGYIALYEHDPAADVVIVQAIRHQSEHSGE